MPRVFPSSCKVDSCKMIEISCATMHAVTFVVWSPKKFVCFVCLLLIYIFYISIVCFSISIRCVSQEGLSLVQSNHHNVWLLQLSNFDKQTHCGTFQSKFLISKLLIQCNTGSCCVHVTGGVNIYACTCVSPMVFVNCVFVCVWYQVRVLAKTMSAVSNL